MRKKNPEKENKPIIKKSKGRQYNKTGNCKTFVASSESNAYISLVSFLDFNRIPEKQIETIRIGIARTFKRKLPTRKFFFPDIPVTKKPSGIRMGKGKGYRNRWVCKVPSGKELIKVVINNKYKTSEALKGLKRLKKKLPIRSKLHFSSITPWICF